MSKFQIQSANKRGENQRKPNFGYKTKPRIPNPRITRPAYIAFIIKWLSLKNIRFTKTKVCRILFWGSSLNDITALGRKGYLGFVTTVPKLNTKKRDDGQGVSKIITNYVTAFMDDLFYFICFCFDRESNLTSFLCNANIP